MPPRRPIRQSPARRALVQMMGAILLVHVIAIAIWRLYVQRQPEHTQRLFGAVWTAITLVIVFAGLFRVRAARRG